VISRHPSTDWSLAPHRPSDDNQAATIKPSMLPFLRADTGDLPEGIPAAPGGAAIALTPHSA